MVALKALRKNAGLSQQKLADLLGVSQSNVAMWETTPQIPRPDTLRQLAALLGCTIDELYKEE